MSTPLGAGTLGAGPGLVIRVLGGLDVTVDGVTKDFRGDLRRRLLLALLAADQRPVSIDRLAVAVWPGETSGGSSNAVQAHVSRVRRLLDPSGERSSHWLLSRPDGYVLRPDHVDAIEVETALTAAETRSATDPKGGFVDLGAALSRWAPPVQSDVQEWQDWSHRLLVKVLGAQDNWAALAARLGTPTDVDAVVALAEAEPTRELRWALAMRGLARTSRQAQALELYQRARRVLASEYGIDPGRELRSMHESILRQEPDVPIGSVEAGPVPALARPPRPVTSFAGREAELSNLEVAMAHSRVVSVVGLGGIGKSRLVTEWVTSSGRFDSCHWVALNDARPGEVAARIAAALGVVLSDGPGSAVPAIIAALPDLPFVLVLDNVDDLAEDAAAVVAALTTAVPQVGVVVTSRVRLGLAGEQVITLSPLAGTDVEGRPGAAHALAAARLEPSASEEEVARVAALSGGVPLAIELLAAGMDLEALAPPDGPTPVAPLDAVARSAVEALPPDSARLFLALLSLPSGASPALVSHLALGIGASPTRSARLIRELIGASLVVSAPVATAQGQSFVRHRVLQPIADLRDAWSTPATEAEDLRSIADWVTGQARTGWFSPPDQAAMASLLPEVATIDHVLGWFAAHRPTDLLDVVTDCFTFLRWSGRAASVEHWLAAAVDDPRSDPITRAKALISVSQGQGLARMAQGLRGLDLAIELLESNGAVGSEVWAVGHAQRAVALGWAGDLAGFDAALDLARSAAAPTDRWFLAHCDSALALSHVLRGTPGVGCGLARQVGREFMDLGDPEAATVAMHFAVQLADWAAAPPDLMRSLFSEGEEYAAGTQPHTRALLAGSRAQFAVRSGSADAAPALLDAIRLMERAGNLRTAGVGRRDLGLLLLRQGQHGRARHQLAIAATRSLSLDRSVAPPALAGLAALSRAGPTREGLALAAWSLVHSRGGRTANPADAALVAALISDAPARLLEEEAAVTLAQACLSEVSAPPDHP